MENINHKEIDLDDVAFNLNRFFQIADGEIIIKGFVPTNIEKSLRVFVRSGDHLPIHFHIDSLQRGYSQKFRMNPIKNISTNTNPKYDGYIEKFFKGNPLIVKSIEAKFFELNLHLEDDDDEK